MTSVYAIDLTANLLQKPPFVGAVAIYGLFDPRYPDDLIQALRYIGKTIVPSSRYRQHLMPSFRKNWQYHKINWINGLIAVGCRPEMRVLAWVTDEEWQETERQYITAAHAAGCDLTNVYAGGEGPTRLTPEQRAKVKAANVGKITSLRQKQIASRTLRFYLDRRRNDPVVKARWIAGQCIATAKKKGICSRPPLSIQERQATSERSIRYWSIPEHRQRLSEQNKQRHQADPTLRRRMTEARKVSQEARTPEQIAESAQRRRSRVRAPLSEEAHQRMSAAQRAHWARATEEQRAAMTKGIRQGTVTAEHRAKIGAALKGRQFSADTRTKMSVSACNKPPVSAETRARMSAARRNRTHSAETRAKITASNNARWARVRQEKSSTTPQQLPLF